VSSHNEVAGRSARHDIGDGNTTVNMSIAQLGNNHAAGQCINRHIEKLFGHRAGSVIGVRQFHRHHGWVCNCTRAVDFRPVQLDAELCLAPSGGRVCRWTILRIA
jgi:hypothetical protein